MGGGYSEFYLLHRLTLFIGVKIFIFTICLGSELAQLFFWVYIFWRLCFWVCHFWQVVLGVSFKIKHFVAYFVMHA